MQILEDAGVLAGFDDTNQMSLFGASHNKHQADEKTEDTISVNTQAFAQNSEEETFSGGDQLSLF